ncbi:hypothetical protein [Methylobacterium sp. V23]|uniref:hypothetical protein n=1 Tax=Methylobacterium sp. V23 TaxID=2044878 RepID=UPI0011B04047|nr:hypothetical protein [Methylobacterium sp. V23]
MQRMVDTQALPSIQSGFRTPSGAKLSKAITDGFGSVLIEVEHTQNQVCSIVGLTAQPYFRLDTVSRLEPQKLASSFFISRAPPPAAEHSNNFVWAIESARNASERLLVVPTILEKAGFDTAFTELFRKAVEANLSLAADLVRADKMGGLLRRSLGYGKSAGSQALRGARSVALVVCCRGSDSFSLGSWVTAKSIRYTLGGVASLWDLSAEGRLAEDIPTQLFDQTKSFTSIYDAKYFMDEHEFVLFLPPGVVISYPLNNMLAEVLNYTEMGKIVQLRTNGESRRLDILTALDAPLTRPRDFQITGFYPVLVRTRDICAVLSGYRCYDSTLVMLFDLLREFPVLEVVVGEEDGLVQTAPPPVHSHPLQMIRSIRNCLEATIPSHGQQP